MLADLVRKPSFINLKKAYVTSLSQIWSLVQVTIALADEAWIQGLQRSPQDPTVCFRADPRRGNEIKTNKRAIHSLGALLGPCGRTLLRAGELFLKGGRLTLLADC